MKCYYYNKGHCRNRNNCRDEHPRRTCQEQNCQGSRCEKRHPKPCRNFFLNRFCYFGSKCSFSHVHDCEDCENLKFIIENDDKVPDTRLKDLETKLKIIEEKNNDLTNEIDGVRKENNSLRVENRNNHKQMGEIKSAMKTAEDHKLKITEAKIGDLEREIEKIKQENDSLRIENVKKQKEIYEINIDMRMLDGENKKMKENNIILEKKFENDNMKYSCMLCEYKCMKNNELQKHKVEKHEIKCDYCNFETFNVGEFELHMNNDHKLVNLTTPENEHVLNCDECDFETVKEEEFTNHLNNVHDKNKISETISQTWEKMRKRFEVNHEKPFPSF